MPTEREQEKMLLEERVRAYARAQGLLRPGDRVIAAVSGGADSMALLLFLLHGCPGWGLSVEAVHVNHGLRGAAADRDEAFVRGFCQKNGVPLTVFKLAEEGAIPPAPGEDWARQARYARFEALARQKNARIATAHTRNDQAETLIFRLARGCGVRGAGAIPPARGPYLRPFLCLARADTERYCALWGQPFCSDATNEGDDYARNLLRHRALPALLGANEGALEALSRFCDQMRQLDGYLEGEGETLLTRARLAEGVYSAPLLAGAPAPVRARALQRMVGPAPAEARHLALMEEALARGGGVQLPGGGRFLVGQGKARYEPAPRPLPAPAPAQPFGPGEYHLPGGYFLKATVADYENFEKYRAVHKKDLNYLADYDKIQQVEPILRTRLPGDVFRPAGRGLEKSLKKWLNEWKLPREERGLLPLLGRESRLFWVWGRGFAEQVKPTGETKRLLLIEQHTEGEEADHGDGS